jgi:hypothetical protein
MAVHSNDGKTVWHDDSSCGVLPKGHKYVSTGTRKPLPPTVVAYVKMDAVVKQAGGKKAFKGLSEARAVSLMYKAHGQVVDQLFTKYRGRDCEVIELDGSRLYDMADNLRH